MRSKVHCKAFLTHFESIYLDNFSKSYSTLTAYTYFVDSDTLQGFKIFGFEIILVFLLEFVELLKDIIIYLQF